MGAFLFEMLPNMSLRLDTKAISIVHPHMGEKGWSFNGDGYEGQGSTELPDHKIPNVIPDSLYNSTHLRDLYFKADKNYDGRFTVPVIWDKKKETIVNNESSEIIRFLNTAVSLFLQRFLHPLWIDMTICCG